MLLKEAIDLKESRERRKGGEKFYNYFIISKIKKNLDIGLSTMFRRKKKI